MRAFPMFTKSVAVAALVFAAAVAFAQSYPSRVVRMVVAYPPGGSIDVVARLVNQRLTTAFGQQFIIDNRAGAAGNIGTDYVAKAANDGYTLLMGSAASISSAPAVYAKLPYDPVRDLAPIIQVANQPNVLTAHPSVPARTLKEFIALAKANPGKFNYGSSGIGASQHMTAELFAMLTGVNIEHIPYIRRHAGDDRSHQRPDRFHVYACAECDCIREERQDPRHRGHQPQAVECAARIADDG